MAIIQTEVPYNAFVDTATGEPLPLGFLYFGEPDQDPEQNPKDVHIRNQAGTLVDISQPVRTNSAGILVVMGAAVQLFINGDYSLRVKNQFGVTLFTSPNSNDSNADTLRASNNLSDLGNVAAAVANLNLTGALLAANNLDDLSNAVTARQNLGLANALLSNNNLSDVADAATARTNLGIDTAAFLQIANNLSDLQSVTNAQANLGLQAGTGTSQSTGVVTFPNPYASGTTPVVVGSQSIGGPNDIQFQVESIDETSFSYSAQTPGTFYWIAIGTPA